MNIDALWAKKSRDGRYEWLPLAVHLSDTAEVAKRLWRKWVPESIRKAIAVSIIQDEQEAEQLFIFLAAAHDIGKATPVFQAARSIPETDLDLDVYNKLLMNGFNVRESRDKYLDYAKTPHALASQLLLENAKELSISDENLSRKTAAILGAHHGKPADTGYSNLIGRYPTHFGSEENAWLKAQSALIKLLLDWSGYNTLAEVPSPSIPGQVLLSGLLIMADWIASDSNKFSLMSPENPAKIDSGTRARSGWDKLNLPLAWEPCQMRNDDNLYLARFGYDPNTMQKVALQAARSLHKPGIMVIEAPMGLGKTEAALVVAEVFRNITNSGGVFFALPTQATSDGIFPRLNKWINQLDLEEQHSVNLVHGKAQFNKDFSKLRLFEGDVQISDNDDHNTSTQSNQESGAAIAHQWFNGRKKAMLADFVVGTIDQLLLMALKQKHVMLRHVGLGGKVVIIDECHAYDAYMSEYLKIALSWLGSYGVPVIVLSATLPADTRRDVIGAYLRQKDIGGDWVESRAYPLITYTDGNDIKYSPVEYEKKSSTVTVNPLAWNGVVNQLDDLLSEGGCAGIILDTVKRAQEMAQILRGHFGTHLVRLIHSRFIAADRLDKEQELRDVLGRNGNRPQKLIVVGTQVLEQSLDIDFDVMITDIAPMDLLLQRMGRLHRHNRRRPEKMKDLICFVTGIDDNGFEKGIDSVYFRHLLMRTKDLLDNANGVVTLPEDITRLVNDTYDRNAEQTNEKDEWETRTADKISRAQSFCMKEPSQSARASLVNWLNTDVYDDPTGKKGEAAVRDTDESIEVLVIKKNGSQFSLVSGKPLSAKTLSAEEAMEIATQSVHLPQVLCYPRIIDKVIQELSSQTHEHVASWLESPWLNGELFLILNDDNAVHLCGYKITYTTEDGLIYIRENTEQDTI